jgi:hypothetical protein
MPAISDLFPPRLRAVIYVITVMLAPAYAVIEANTNLHFGWQAAYAAWNGLAGALAVSNTTNSATIVEQAELQQHLEIVDQVNRFAEVEG